MISVPVRNMAGAECGTYAFEPSEVSDVICNQLLHDAVVMYNANRRLGEVQTKSRGMVSGSTRSCSSKRALAGLAPGQFERPCGVGAVTHSPRSRVIITTECRKRRFVKQCEWRLLSKFQDAQAVMLDSWQCIAPKTKVVAQFLNAVGLTGKSVLLTTEGLNPNVWKSARNIKGVEILPGSDLNAYTLLRQRHLVITVGEMDRLLGRKA